MNAFLPMLNSSHADILEVFAPTSTSAVEIPHILAVDDDESLRHLVVHTLTRAGFLVAAASDGECGWRALRSEYYDLLITDYSMPRLDGLALTTRLRQAGMKTPVILATGSEDLAGNPGFDPSDFAQVLHKPFSLVELTDAVRRVLRTDSGWNPPTPASNEPPAETHRNKAPQLRVAVAEEVQLHAYTPRIREMAPPPLLRWGLND